MILKKLKTKSSKKLLLFFAGWSMDEHPFLHYEPSDSDFIIVYNYDSLDFDESLLIGYEEVKVVAWSMGVWAAAQVLANSSLPVVMSIAVNGTLFPVDDKKGIAVDIFNATLKNLNEQSLIKFRRRICGSKEVYERFQNNPPRRELTDLKNELKKLGELSTKLKKPSFNFDRVYVSNRDLAILTKNQQCAWKDQNVILIDAPHYPEALFSVLFN